MAPDAGFSCAPVDGFFRNPLERKAIGGWRMEIQFRRRSSLRRFLHDRYRERFFARHIRLESGRNGDVLCNVAGGIRYGTPVGSAISNPDALGRDVAAD